MRRDPTVLLACDVARERWLAAQQAEAGSAEIARLTAILDRVREACQPRPAYSTQAVVRAKFRAEILALLGES